MTRITRNRQIAHGSSPPNFRGGDLKISDQNNWGGGGGWGGRAKK